MMAQRNSAVFWKSSLISSLRDESLKTSKWSFLFKRSVLNLYCSRLHEVMIDKYWQFFINSVLYQFIYSDYSRLHKSTRFSRILILHSDLIGDILSALLVTLEGHSSEILAYSEINIHVNPLHCSVDINVLFWPYSKRNDALISGN